MLQRSEELYQLLIKDIGLCKEKGDSFLSEIECCFHSSESYWAILREELIPYQFPSEDEEIHFFKRIKPKFISEIEYYSLLYHTEMFRPDASFAEKLKDFWTREFNRTDKFISNNAEFYAYHKAGETNLDVLYFTRANYDIYPDLEIKYYNRNPGSATSHDHLVAEIIALERYREYASANLLSCTE